MLHFRAYQFNGLQRIGISACVAQIFQNGYQTLACKRNIEMTPLCKVEVTLPRALGSREVRRGGVVDEQAGVQPS